MFNFHGVRNISHCSPVFGTLLNDLRLEKGSGTNNFIEDMKLRSNNSHNKTKLPSFAVITVIHLIDNDEMRQDETAADITQKQWI